MEYDVVASFWWGSRALGRATRQPVHSNPSRLAIVWVFLLPVQKNAYFHCIDNDILFKLN